MVLLNLKGSTNALIPEAAIAVRAPIIAITIITSAIKHEKKVCAMPVVIENGDHAFIYLFAGAIVR